MTATWFAQRRPPGDRGVPPEPSLSPEAPPETIRRVFEASLQLHAALSIAPSGAYAVRLWRAIDELDAALAEMRRDALRHAVWPPDQ